MVADGSVNIDSKIDGSGFSSGLNKLNGAAKTALGALTGIVGGVGAALAGAAVAGVKYNAQMEQYITSFGTMLGSAEKAQVAPHAGAWIEIDNRAGRRYHSGSRSPCGSVD